MRVSTDEQNPDAQRDALLRAGVAEDNLYVDHTSGAKSSRPQWDVVTQVLRANGRVGYRNCPNAFEIM